MSPTVGTHVVRAPRGTTLSCKGWPQEAALRMLMNNLDPEVAERPEDLVVYGGRGKAARSWEAYERIVAALRALENDETLLIQSGKPVGVFRTWVKHIEKGEFPHTSRHFGVMRCNHCDDSPCTEICPTTALYRRAASCPAWCRASVF